MANCCVWDFTAQEGQYDIDDCKVLLRKHCKSWTFQEEMNSKGKLHLQGRFSLKLKSRLQPLIYLMDNNWHYSTTSDENRDNTFYVMKEDTRVQGPWSDKDKVLYIPRQIRGVELYPWQKQVVASKDLFDTRIINIIVDKKGNIGKTTLRTHIGAYELGRALPYLNDYKDLMRMVMDTPKKSLYIIDIPRAMKRENAHAFWSSIEEIKNGYAWDDRYHFKEEYFDSPQIWVFTNSFPELSFLSRDRWRFWRISSKMELKRVKVPKEADKPVILKK